MPDDFTGRREFLRTAGAAFTASLFTGNLRGANDKVRVGFIGVGRMGSGNIGCAAKVPGFEIAAVCDVYQPALDSAEAQARKLGFDGVQAKRDFRAVLADKSIDAVCISAPDHWRACMAVEACKAGKDVWVEKPACVYVEEGPKMVRAARQHNRVAQAGTIGRSSEVFRQAREVVKSGALGEIGFCRAFDDRRGMGEGLMTGRGVRLLDMVQWAFDEAMPISISAQGGRSYSGGGGETLRTTLATFRYSGFVASYESRATNTRATGGGGYGVSFHGSKATLMVNRAGCFLYPNGANAEPVIERRRTAGSRAPHWRNFLECIRSRRRPISDIETCVRTTTTCLLSNLALRHGVTLDWDEKAFSVKQGDIKRYLEPEYGSPWKLEV
jgi:predicted dehydrogenase